MTPHPRGSCHGRARRPKKNPFDEYPDDIFKDTRMSFGDHIEELRTRMIRALKWLLLFMVIGFILDAIGKSVGNPKIGVGHPMLTIITDPIEIAGPRLLLPPRPRRSRSRN